MLIEATEYGVALEERLTVDSSKDYYTNLGVLPTAEPAVIRAAYRALAQQYHPDCYEGDKQEAHRKMVELNEAYSVLKDPQKREEFDSERKRSKQSGDSYFTAGNRDSPPRTDPLAEDWKLANRFFDDLMEIEARLSKISWRLGYSFRALLLEVKEFENRESVAQHLEQQFFEFHFGKSPQIIAFARDLILSGKRDEAADLSRAMQVLGENVDPRLILAKFRPQQPEFDSNLSESDQEELLDHYGIEASGGTYFYGPNSYSSLREAVAYAKVRTPGGGLR